MNGGSATASVVYSRDSRDIRGSAVPQTDYGRREAD